MKKFFLTLLAIILMLGSFASCHKKPDEPSAGTTAGSETVTAGDKPALKPEDFGNNEFKILARGNRYAYLYVEEDSKDRLESAVWKRNQLINQMFNIDMKVIPAGKDDASWWKNALQASSGEYDLCVPDYYWQIEQSGFLVDIKTLNEINLNDFWWTKGWNDNVSVNGKLFNVMGPAALESLENLEAVFFNIPRAKALNINLYDIVDNGDWTIDKMLEYSKLSASNLDGSNAEAPIVYGALYDMSSQSGQIYASGIQIFHMDDNSIPQYCANREQNLNYCDKLSLLINDDSVNYDPHTARRSDNLNKGYFKNNQALFFSTALYLGRDLKLSNLSFQYGIIPQPKTLKEQDYVSTFYGASFFAIPGSTANLHRSAVILNALNYLSDAKNDMGTDALTYQYYDTIVMTQIANSPDDSRMLDLIRSVSYVDFGYVYDTTLRVHHQFEKAIIKKTSVTPLLESLSETLPEELSKLIAAYK